MRERFVEAALIEARKSSMIHAHGCVIVRRGKIVGQGHNRCIFRDGHRWSEHAEVAACKSLPSYGHLRGCQMYVVRLRRGSGEANFSRPCRGCSKFLRAMMQRQGLREVFYSL